MDEIIQRKKKLPILIKLLFFLGILFILDFSFGKLLRHFYFKQDSGILYRTTYALDSTKADILIFGSSTASHHYIPEFFKEKFHESCYNTGRDGNSILFSYAILKSLLKRYTPKMIVLDVNDKEFIKDHLSYDRISSLLPYYDSHPELRSIILLRSPFEKYKLVSRIYPFNSLLFTIGIGNQEANKSRNYVVDYDGYVPLNYVWKSTLFTDTTYSQYQIDSTKVNIFRTFLEDCKKLNISIFVFTSPKFTRYTHQDSSIEIIEDITRKLHIPYYNFINDSFFLSHKELFHNLGHLNASGAEIFTKRVIDTIFKSKQN